MINKIKQLNSLINLNEQKYRSLLIRYDIVFSEFTDSTESVSNLSTNIDKNNKVLVDLMESKGQDIIEQYTIINDYIKMLLDDIEIKSKENQILKEKVEILDDELISLKVESKGYELLVEQHENEMFKIIRHAENKEIDDNWLLSRR